MEVERRPCPGWGQVSRYCPAFVPLCPGGAGQLQALSGAGFRVFVPLSRVSRCVPLNLAGGRTAAPSPGFPLLHGREVSPAGKDAHRGRYGPKNSPPEVAGAGGVLVEAEGLQDAVGVQKVLRRLAAYLGEPGGPIR